MPGTSVSTAAQLLPPTLALCSDQSSLAGDPTAHGGGSGALPRFPVKGDGESGRQRRGYLLNPRVRVSVLFTFDLKLHFFLHSALN
jgi:hypothetical protein